MPFITTRRQASCRQISWDDIFCTELDAERLVGRDTASTYTIYKEQVPLALQERTDVQAMIVALKNFVSRYSDLYEASRERLYYSFSIPKKTGGRRPIDAPHPRLMVALRDLKSIFENQIGVLYHTSAYAYIHNRCALDAVIKHYQNGSRWYAHFDFSNFFGSTTPEFVLKMFSMVYPLSAIMMSDEGAEALAKALDLCFLRGGLPQGTPISPLITNVMMIPFDHKVTTMLRGKGFVYTRYADDIHISGRDFFDVKELEGRINAILGLIGAPFAIKPEKTRFGSVAGQNWMLGVMVSKDGIHVGREKKKVLRAKCDDYIVSRQEGHPWDLHDVLVLDGLLAYYNQVEPDYTKGFINSINRRYNVDLNDMIRKDKAM